jgi:hypothetical protein
LRLSGASRGIPPQLARREIEIHETKGFWEEDARIKFKVAAATYPFRFIGVTRETSRIGLKVWTFEEFSTPAA